MLTYQSGTPESSFDDELPQCTLVSTRRTFLQLAGMCAGCAVAMSNRGFVSAAFGADNNAEFRREASFYKKLSNKLVQCELCPRACTVADGDRGFCRVRENSRGTYYTLVHSRVVAAHIDPIEKKPFFHFMPGTLAYSVASGGCNVNCKFCQNWQISQAQPDELRGTRVSPEALAGEAKRIQTRVLAYTYSEPVVWWEYVMDTAEAGHREGVRSVMVSNGFIQQEPLRRLCGRLDAIKIDLKSFSATYYRDVVRGELKPVLESIRLARKEAKWLEIVYLVVPTLNDSDSEIRDMARWMTNEIGTDVPVHFTRFQPLYLLRNLPPTPVETLERLKAVADAEGLQYVYIGNLPGHKAENTYCPKCRQLLIERSGFTIAQMRLKKSKCPKCAHAVPGIWA